MTASANRLLPATCLALIGALALSACATSDDAPPVESAEETAGESAAGHGGREGASEVSEPPLQLLTAAADGAVGMLDLLDGTAEHLGEIAVPEKVVSDGRYLFAQTADGLEVVDSGVWSWDHGDHFHYYRSSPELLGALPGDGPVTVTASALSTAGHTGVFFAGSGEAVLLENAELDAGRLVEAFRLDAADAGVVAPLADGAVVGQPDAGGAGAVRFYDADGSATDASATCADPQDAVTTRAALVVRCADGVVLATATGGEPEFVELAFPEGVSVITEFAGRKGRPTVAALAEGGGILMLDTRAGEWTTLASDVALAAVTAVDDSEGHVVALAEDGSVHVFTAEGEALAATPPLEGVVATAAGTAIAVDGNRAYLNAPDAGVVYEIDYADDARIARTLETPTTPVFFAEVGR